MPKKQQDEGEFAGPEWLVELGIHKTTGAAGKARCVRSASTPAYYKVGRKVLYNKHEVLEWLSHRRVDPTKPEEA